MFEYGSFRWMDQRYRGWMAFDLCNSTVLIVRILWEKNEKGKKRWLDDNSNIGHLYYSLV